MFKNFLSNLIGSLTSRPKTFKVIFVGPLEDGADFGSKIVKSGLATWQDVTKTVTNRLLDQSPVLSRELLNKPIYFVEDGRDWMVKIEKE